MESQDHQSSNKQCQIILKDQFQDKFSKQGDVYSESKDTVDNSKEMKMALKKKQELFRVEIRQKKNQHDLFQKRKKLVDFKIEEQSFTQNNQYHQLESASLNQNREEQQQQNQNNQSYILVQQNQAQNQINGQKQEQQLTYGNMIEIYNNIYDILQNWQEEQNVNEVMEKLLIINQYIHINDKNQEEIIMLFQQYPYFYQGLFYTLHEESDCYPKLQALVLNIIGNLTLIPIIETVFVDSGVCIYALQMLQRLQDNFRTEVCVQLLFLLANLSGNMRSIRERLLELSIVPNLISLAQNIKEINYESQQWIGELVPLIRNLCCVHEVKQIYPHIQFFLTIISSIYSVREFFEFQEQNININQQFIIKNIVNESTRALNYLIRAKDDESIEKALKFPQILERIQYILLNFKKFPVETVELFINCYGALISGNNYLQLQVIKNNVQAFLQLEVILIHYFAIYSKNSSQIQQNSGFNQQYNQKQLNELCTSCIWALGNAVCIQNSTIQNEIANSSIIKTIEDIIQGSADPYIRTFGIDFFWNLVYTFDKDLLFKMILKDQILGVFYTPILDIDQSNILTALDGLNILLGIGKIYHRECSGENIVIKKYDEMNLPEILEQSQLSKYDKVVDKVQQIIETYYVYEDVTLQIQEENYYPNSQY